MNGKQSSIPGRVCKNAVVRYAQVRNQNEAVHEFYNISGKNNYYKSPASGYA
jgi:hypothetical protein